MKSLMIPNKNFKIINSLKVSECPSYCNYCTYTSAQWGSLSWMTSREFCPIPTHASHRTPITAIPVSIPLIRSFFSHLTVEQAHWNWFLPDILASKPWNYRLYPFPDWKYSKKWHKTQCCAIHGGFLMEVLNLFPQICSYNNTY